MVPSDLQGVGHFRNIWAAQSIQKNFSDEFEVDINHQVKFNDYDALSKYDIIHFHRQFGPFEEFPKVAEELKKRGVITIMDIDDYWQPPTTHPLYEIAKAEKYPEKILNNIKHAEYITTTTTTFKKYIEAYNKNVYVIPNALDMNHKMWSSPLQKNLTDKCRISWIGGSSHLHDLNLLDQSMQKLNHSPDLKDKFQIIMCGFDTRGTVTQLGANNEKTTRKIKPHETIWCNFEKIFTSNYELLKDDEEYVKWLKKIKKEQYPEEYTKNFVRRWTLPLTQYGKHYDYCDVCLAPLKRTETYKELPGGEIVAIIDPRKGTIKTRPHYFNEVKSELKLIESGMKKKVLIAENFGICKELIKNGETGILVENSKKDWYKAMRKVINDPGYRNALAENLHNFVKDKYEITSVTKDRLNIYKEILKQKKIC